MAGMLRRVLQWAEYSTISLVIATIGACISGYAAFWGSAMFFGYLYPHDGQDVLGAVFVGIMAIPVTWILLFLVSMWGCKTWTEQRRLRTEEREKTEAAQEKFTITGRPI